MNASTDADGDNKIEKHKHILRHAIRIAVCVDLKVTIGLFAVSMVYISTHFTQAKPSANNSNSTTIRPPKAVSHTRDYINICLGILELVAKLFSTFLFIMAMIKSKKNQDLDKCLLYAKAALIITLVINGVFGLVALIDTDDSKSRGYRWMTIGLGLYYIFFAALLAPLVWYFIKLLKGKQQEPGDDDTNSMPLEQEKVPASSSKEDTLGESDTETEHPEKSS